MDDCALVQALRDGDPEAPRRFLEAHQGLIYGLCLRMMGHRQDAEDVAQESLLRALRGLDGFDANRPLRPWLLGIAANRCRTALSRRSRLHSIAEFPESLPDHRPGVADPDDLAGALEAALAKLRTEYRMVFALFHEQGLPYEEIAEAVGRPLGTVKTWLHRARSELAAELTRRGVECPP